MNEVMGRCPVCGQKFYVRRMECPSCNSALEGVFELCKFCYLSKEQKKFIEVFIKCRGNLKEMEKELGISYPTIRNRLDSVIVALGYKVDNDEECDMDRVHRKEILEQIEKGELSVQEALRLLKESKK